jgi:RNase P subunit RPR2
MQKEQREMCSYCNKWFAKKNMISSHEKGKQIVLYYCESCYPEVRSNINSLPWKDNFTFYRH